MQVTVHKVGVRQLRQWQLADGCTGVLWCDDNRKSPRVGDYVLLSNYAWFGGMQARPTVQLCFGDLGVVLAALRGAMDYSARWDADLLECGTDYEVWHVVDDSELWDEWERRATECATVTDSDDSAVRMYHLYAKPRCVLCGDDVAGPWVTYRSKRGDLICLCEGCIEGARLA